jgi:hypothetical protein
LPMPGMPHFRRRLPEDVRKYPINNPGRLQLTHRGHPKAKPTATWNAYHRSSTSNEKALQTSRMLGMLHARATQIFRERRPMSAADQVYTKKPQSGFLATLPPIFTPTEPL